VLRGRGVWSLSCCVVVAADQVLMSTLPPPGPLLPLPNLSARTRCFAVSVIIFLHPFSPMLMRSHLPPFSTLLPPAAVTPSRGYSLNMLHLRAHQPCCLSHCLPLCLAVVLFHHLTHAFLWLPSGIRIHSCESEYPVSPSTSNRMAHDLHLRCPLIH
jgi:hypothetical protein